MKPVTGNMREKRMTRVYVDSTMETTVADNGHTHKMTTTKTRGFNSRVTAARWLARRELQQRIATEYNPQNNEEWQAAIMKIFPADPYPYWYYSQSASRQWITNRAAEIVEEWGAMKLPKSQRAKEKAQNQARIEESERRWKSMTTEQQDEEILNERVKAKWKALDIELASHDKEPIDTVVTEMFTSSELASLPEALFPFVVIQYRGKTFLTCIANYRICEKKLECGLAVQNPDGLFLAVYDLNGKPWPCEDDQAVWKKPGIFFHQIMKPGVVPMLAVQLGQRIGELCL